jgi:hypothetical protein
MHSDNVIVLRVPDGPPLCRSWRTSDRSSMTTAADFESAIALDEIEPPGGASENSNQFEGMAGSVVSRNSNPGPNT